MRGGEAGGSDRVKFLEGRGGFRRPLKAFPLGGRWPRRGRMRGQISERIVVGRENFAACGRRVLLSPFRRARRLGAPSHRVSPCGASFFPSDGKETKGSPGTAQDERFALIFALPRTPFTGVPPEKFSRSSGAQNLSGWSEFPPGHWALGMQKLPLLRFNLCACLCRANAFGANPGGPVWDRPLRRRETVFVICCRGGSQTRPLSSLPPQRGKVSGRRPDG